jgi:hypothetical protein
MASVNPTSKPNTIPERYRRITPAPIVRGAVKALEFYAEVSGHRAHALPRPRRNGRPCRGRGR